MKIIFVDNSLLMLCNFRLDVAEYYMSKGHHCILCYPLSTETEELKQRISEKMTLAPISCDPSKISPKSDWGYYKELRALYKQVQPDIIFHYTIKPNIYGTIAAKSLGLKCVDMVAGLGYMFEGSGLKKIIGRAMYKFALKRADYVITLNQTIYNFLLRRNYVNKEKFELFEGGEGVNLKKYPYSENSFETIRFLMIARILYDKGYSEFAEAAGLVKKKYPNVVCELLGPFDEISPMGVPKSVVEQDIKNGKINYLGVTNDVPSIVKRPGVVVVVVSSYHEGLNRALMEGCAMARPLITTSIPGCREIVDEGVNGFLVPKKNAQALADAMIRFIELPEKQKKAMAEASYKKAKATFSLEDVLKKYDAILDRVLDK